VTEEEYLRYRFLFFAGATLQFKSADSPWITIAPRGAHGKSYLEHPFEDMPPDAQYRIRPS